MFNWQDIEFEKIIDLYKSVGWDAYTKDPDSLKKAFKNSTYVQLEVIEDKVVGLIRTLSDDVSIHYIQDILVRPSAQRSGVGRKLFENALAHFSHVRTHLLLTDNEEKKKFFRVPWL
jgi:ribosomal protein S18 acetylase RimI-like enzyme